MYDKPLYAHQIVRGDIFVCSWGYDQTNVDFYQVVKRTPKTVTVRQVAAETLSDGPLTMTGKARAIPGQFIGEPMRRKMENVLDNAWISINSYAAAKATRNPHEWNRTSSYA